MTFDLSIVIDAKEERDENAVQQKLKEALRQKYSGNESAAFVLQKRSVDARHGQLKLFLKYKAYIGQEAPSAKKEFSWRKADGTKKVVVVGSGPAGLFASLKLLESGITPVIIERGKMAAERKRDIAAISAKGIVGQDSNYCFGEGGAGTFSDGKLYTRSDKRGNIDDILQAFVYFGADERVLTDAHPHIGTNRLPQIVGNIRQKIVELGGEFHFECRAIGFIMEDSGGQKIVRGIRVLQKSGGLETEKEFFADAVILAAGHSADDIYELLHKIAPEALEAKAFAVGVRVEHPRELIDAIQYHGKSAEGLGAAEYRLTAQVGGRGAYSFCMCPGGFVVPSASGPEQIVVNGMSAAGRNSAWSNSAIVVETRPEDIERIASEIARADGAKKIGGDLGLASNAGGGDFWADGAEEILDAIKSAPALAGLYFRKCLERMTYHNGGISVGESAQKAPAQRLEDFLKKRTGASLPRSSYTPGLVPSRLDEWLPPFISGRLFEAFNQFGKRMRGFISQDVLLIASETRTSTPVRIARQKETFECAALKNLFPCGEGSGWSGGIVSSAMDGENCARALAKKFGL